eukprot:scaffold179518_cov37-Prasinocladus_malaysianus.AAC.1
MLDKLVAEIIHSAMTKIDAIEQQREYEAQWEYDKVFQDRQKFVQAEGITACCTTEDGGCHAILHTQTTSHMMHIHS